MATKSGKWPWSALDLRGPSVETRDVRRAYAVRLKALSPDDVAGFEELRRAYETALKTCRKAPVAAAAAVEIVTSADTTSSPSPEPSGQNGQDAPATDRVSKAAAIVLAPQAPDAPLLREPSPELPATDIVPAQAWDSEAAAQTAHMAYLETVQTMLNRNTYSLSLWEPVFASPFLHDPAFLRLVEGMIVTKLGAGLLDVPASWNRQADEVFGWSADGVGFTRRYPFAVGFLAQVAADKARSGAEPQTRAAGSGSWLWLFISISGLAGLMRVAGQADPAVSGIILALICFGMACVVVGFVFFFGLPILASVLGFLGRYRPELLDLRYAMKRAVEGNLARVTPLTVSLMGAVVLVWLFFMAVAFKII